VLAKALIIVNRGNVLKSLISLVLVALLFASVVSCAEEEATPTPCEGDTRFNQFDFWIGKWDVHTGAGVFAGTNEIESAYDSCMLIERWTSASGGRGMSINYLDHESGDWVQIWNDGSGSQINIRGGMTENGMLLLGKIHYVARNKTVSFRGLWTPLSDGRVRQFFEQLADDGKTWNTWFEGFYTRKSAD